MPIQATPIAGIPLLGALAGRFTDLATVYAAVEANVKGDVTTTHAVVRAGHEDIPAIVAPGNVGNTRMKREEMMASAVTTEMEYDYVLLSGAWPLIDLQDEIEFNSDGLRWAIVAIDIDQTQTFTKLYCERMNPGNI
jgi:hypothetical protein